ncbi:MAG: hypothetical protein HY064_10885 [Bacteroidetes bacterium]|nr:hypothetical protein [Bacteroidota bacterium]
MSLLFVPVFGQSDSDYFNFPDTVRSALMQKMVVKNLDSLKIDFVDTFYKPHCYLVELNSGTWEYSYSIAMKVDSVWNIYALPEIAGSASFYKAQRVMFDTIGNKELLLRFVSMIGNTNRTSGDGWGEKQETVFLINPDNMVLLFSVENYFSHIQWSGDGGEMDNECDHYTLAITPGKIVLKQTGNCNDFGEEIFGKISDPLIVTYFYNGICFFREK